MPLANKNLKDDILEGEDPRGKLKIFLGYAPGVGKTFSMLDEAVRRKKRGQDVAVGAVDSRARQATTELLDNFEAIPGRAAGPDSPPTEDMDVDAIIARRPGVLLVDDL